ncbi:hypothetical protein BST91_05625 [Nonlabens tegetincola]|uniref:hypothetical protein n=1 Tax=Nonlabens tegetincola TaxID=323273 RepID=UPI000A2037DC|nr:hypothetical protein [Nonlabens tegetincola]ARN71165.1 hypothetical protein BST91_05625 [Nonlabens tegetincola]
MRKTLTFLLIILVNTAYAQLEFEELKQKISAYETVQEFDSLITSKYLKKMNAFLVYYEFKRPVDRGYQQNRITIDDYIKINFVSKNGKVMFGWISKFDSYNERIKHTEEIKPAENKIKSYIKIHNSLYNSQLTEKELKTQILAEYVVGFGCGYSGNYISDESSKMMKYVKRKDIKSLNKWLTAFSPELQVLGTIGLIQLGVVNEEQRQIIERLKTRNSTISNCMGCIYSYNTEFKKLIEIHTD